MKIIIVEDVFDETSFKEFEASNLIEFLQSNYDKFPENTRIYHNSIAISNDVTPNSEIDIEILSKLDGVFFVVTYPHATTIVIAVALVAVAAAAFLLKPKIPATTAVANANAETSSPNNQSLSTRQNTARLNARIPDIYGQVRSIPDLISLPYTFFDSNGNEFELSYMCVGRGDYEITDIKEGSTPVVNLASNSYQIYSSNTSPNNSVPVQQIGATITNPLISYIKNQAVNGQTLIAPNANALPLTTGTFAFSNMSSPSGLNGTVSPTQICQVTTQVNGVNFSSLFAVGDVITLTSTTNPNVNGTYTITSFVTQRCGFNGNYDALASSPNWPAMRLTPRNATFFDNNYVTNNANYGYGLNITTAMQSRNLSITKVGVSSIIGPFTISETAINKILVNFVAPNGQYLTSGVTVRTTITSIANGTTQIINTPLTPVNKYASQKGYSLFIDSTIASPFTIKFERTTNLVTGTGAGNDEIRIRDLFYGNLITTAHFGNVTTVYALSTTSQSNSERKFNCLAYRKISTGNSAAPPSGINNAGSIIVAICLDSKIGRRSVSEIDTDNIFATIDTIYKYFGLTPTIETIQFNYTFDKTDMSFEEMIASIAASIHCVAYRQGNIIKLKFEKENSVSTLLFNHRNVIPNTMQRAVSFGVLNDYDGVTFKYIDPNNDQEAVLYVPNSTINNPKEIQMIGVRSKIQAYYLAWRAWNRLKYQTIAVDFEALQESNLLTISDRLLVSDNTRNDTQDGEIINQNGLTLTLSSEVSIVNGDSIFIQHYDGTVASRIIVSQLSPNQIIINSAPSLPIITDNDNYAKTTFIIAKATSNVNLPFILTDKQPANKFTNTIKAINYSANYYANDHVNPSTI